MKADEQVVTTIKIEPALLGKVDERAKSLDLNRSQYFRRLVREDLAANPLPSKQLELQEVHA